MGTSIITSKATGKLVAIIKLDNWDDIKQYDTRLYDINYVGFNHNCKAVQQKHNNVSPRHNWSI